MKKGLLILPVLMIFGCAPAAEGQLPPVDPTSYTVKLDAISSTLSTDESTSAIQVELKAKEDETIVYKLEIGSPCYAKSVDGHQEIVMKSGAYFKSVSSYKVSRLICDIYEGKGINYEVHNKAAGSDEALARHESTIEPEYKEDSGAVYEYEVNSNEWSITNTSVYKPTFYSVTIVFEA